MVPDEKGTDSKLVILARRLLTVEGLVKGASSAFGGPLTAEVTGLLASQE
jgi:hypothetical protein